MMDGDTPEAVIVTFGCRAELSFWMWKINNIANAKKSVYFNFFVLIIDSVNCSFSDILN